MPIFYGDWVPIDSAKAQIESLASSVQAAAPSNNRRKDEESDSSPSILITDDFTAPVKSSFTFTDVHSHTPTHPNEFHSHHQTHEAEERVEIDLFPPTRFIGPKLPGQHNREQNVRYNSGIRTYNRGRNQYRRGNGAGVNSRRKHRPTNSDALTRLFGPSLGWNNNRRRDRKIPQPQQSSNSIPFVDQITSLFGGSSNQQTSVPQTTASSGSIALETLETLGNRWPSLPNIKSPSHSDDLFNVHETSESSFQPIVKLLPPPDLAQVKLL